MKPPTAMLQTLIRSAMTTHMEVSWKPRGRQRNVWFLQVRSSMTSSTTRQASSCPLWTSMWSCQIRHFSLWADMASNHFLWQQKVNKCPLVASWAPQTIHVKEIVRKTHGLIEVGFNFCYTTSEACHFTLWISGLSPINPDNNASLETL